MAYQISRTDEEIDDLREKCIEQENEGGSKYHGLTYEQGIEAAVGWLVGDRDDNPMED